jgi:hypothetical protein
VAASFPEATELPRRTNHRFGPETDSSAQQASGRAFPAVSFGYLSVECPFNKFYGINCHHKLGAKLLDRFFHRRRQVSPPQIWSEVKQTTEKILRLSVKRRQVVTINRRSLFKFVSAIPMMATAPRPAWTA